MGLANPMLPAKSSECLRSPEQPQVSNTQVPFLCLAHAYQSVKTVDTFFTVLIGKCWRSYAETVSWDSDSNGASEPDGTNAKPATDAPSCYPGTITLFTPRLSKCLNVCYLLLHSKHTVTQQCSVSAQMPAETANRSPRPHRPQAVDAQVPFVCKLPCGTVLQR